MPPPPGGGPPRGDDAVLALRDRGDHRAALIALMQAHGATVYAHCVRVVKDPTLAQDVQQQVFLEAFRDLPGFGGRSALRTWLISIANHRCLDAIKARRRREDRISGDDNAVVSVPDASPNAGEQLDGQRRARVLDECLGGLSESVRVAVLTQFNAGLSYDEMSAMFGERAGTLQARVTRALPVLRRCLESKGVTL